MTTAADIAAAQSLVARPLGPAIRRWLETGKPAHLFGLPLLGLPVSPAPDNCWGATLLLQSLRPALPKAFLAIRLLGGRALCIQPLGEKSNATPMVEIELNGEALPRDTGITFETYLQQGEADLRRAGLVLDHVERIIREEKYEYDHASGGKLPRAHQRRIVRACVHDFVVGLAALRQDDQRNDTVIGLFEATDHPLYEPGHGVRSLAALMLADAYKSGVSMALRFEAVAGLRGKTVPEALVALADELGVALTGADAGRVSHDEGLALFAGLSGLSPEALARAAGLPPPDRASVAALSYLAISRCWQVEEIEWILQAAPRPAAVLFGDDLPEDWLLQSDAAAYGRAAVLLSMLRASLTGDGEEGIEAAAVSLAQGVFTLEVRRDAVASWLGDRVLRAGEVIAVLPRPRHPLGFEPSLVSVDARHLASLSADADQRWLVYSEEHAAVDLTMVADDLDAAGVEVIVSPYWLPDLQEIYDARINRSRRARR